ncbi:TPA: SAM-dependent DNA methyltransferase [Vibrio parahaemolyticus]|nr:SAM-dependent DNA methyltransferase [Vibrio parahaemolyticus]
MRQALDKTLRKKLEDTVVKARDIVEQAVFEALQRLGVAEAQAPSYLNEEERALRNKLRAHARQLGDKLKDGKQETERLINEMAYEHWHRMLFARYLEQNNLLMYDEYTPVTLDECFELAEEEPNCKDGWELAGRLAQKMLPQIFRVDSPVFDIKLSMNRVEELESLIAQLDPKTYQAQDSLGWCYQFWQTKKKDQVNKSGVKIGAQELSPVTQLFTEPYMVSFLLDNALGAWWANKRLSQDDLIRANNEQELRELAAIPGVPLEYLRFSKEEEATQWKPAAGGFEKWPEHLSELKTLDPCCGSGHFLVAVFLMLVPMRMQLEGLSEKQAVDAVLRDNIHGLELDQRCVELAAFALALEAWRYPNSGGYRILPELQLACSGMSITEAQKEWSKAVEGNIELESTVQIMRETFEHSPELGSLIIPPENLVEQFSNLNKVLNDLSVADRDTYVVAQGLVKAATLLSSKYQWVFTNVPYLALRKESPNLAAYTSSKYPNTKQNLAVVFIERLAQLMCETGTVSHVCPQDWIFLDIYKEYRQSFLKRYPIHVMAKLGVKSFSTPMWDMNIMLFSHGTERMREGHTFNAIDVSYAKDDVKKGAELQKATCVHLPQQAQLSNPDGRIVFSEVVNHELLIKSANALMGVSTGDGIRFHRRWWEINSNSDDWEFIQGTVSNTKHYAGRTEAIFWQKEKGEIYELAESVKHLNHSAQNWQRGRESWGSKGVNISQMGHLPATLYEGDIYDCNCCSIIPNSEVDLIPLWLFAQDPEFNSAVRTINQALKVPPKTLLKIPFDKDKWSQLANDLYPNGLPRPYTDDLTQWIFHGHPCASVIWDEESKTTAIANLRQDDTVLQVAVARLLGYQWPAELDPEMELAPEMREVMKKNADFAGLIDDDGIVCIPAVRGEKTAAKRLEAILHKAYGDEWTSSVEQNLLKAVKAKDLEIWLRDKFFDQHCKLFQHRPFIWQVWDGLKDGFSALVNYHKLDYKGLERLIYTYLDDWISTQKGDIADGKDGADIRLTAAENLKKQLEAILEGEKGLDIFVRWKPLAEQPIGWNPDLNDGVRLNIRPFMLAKDVGKKGAGVLRGKPNIHWKKDRGTDVASAPWFDLGPVYGEKEGSRINDHHLTLAEKKAAREQAND